jgi:hypothetical protein
MQEGIFEAGAPVFSAVVTLFAVPLITWNGKLKTLQGLTPVIRLDLDLILKTLLGQGQKVLYGFLLRHADILPITKW